MRMRDADKTRDAAMGCLTGGKDEEEKKIICDFAGIVRDIHDDAAYRKWGGWRMLRTEPLRMLL